MKFSKNKYNYNFQNYLNKNSKINGINLFNFSFLILFLFSSISYNSLFSSELKRVNSNQFMTVVNIDNSIVSNKNNNISSLPKNEEIDFVIENNLFKTTFVNNDNLYLENFPIGDNKFGNLRLYYSNPAVDENTKINIHYNGKVTQAPIPDFKIYSGTIDGDQESDVMLIITNNSISGIVQTGFGKQYNLGKNLIVENNIIELNKFAEKNNKTSNQKFETANSLNNLHTLSLSDRASLEHNLGITNTCGVSDKEQNPNGYGNDFLEKFNDDIKQSKNTVKVQSTEILEATIALEANFEYFLLFKRNQNRQDQADNQQAITRGTEYMIQVMSMSSLVYRRELNITLKIGNIDFYADSSRDPYRSVYNRDLSVKLNRMRTTWSNRNSVKRSVVSLFTNLRAQPANSTIAGIAYVGSPRSGVLCSNNQGFNALGIIGSFAYPTMNFTTDVNVTAHELGHNFSSPHTHNCYFQPQIDTCLTQETHPNTDACLNSESLLRKKLDGDIMSYCFLGGGSILKFHPRIKELIRTAAANAKNNCVTNPTTPTLQLVTPKGQEKFTGGQVIDITWNVFNVNRLKISFSSNGGEIWENITNDISAVSDSVFKWKSPEITTKNALIKIEDITNSNVNDVSILPFELQRKEIYFLYPQDGAKVGYLSPTNIQWFKSAVDNVNLKLSLDGGKTFNTISSASNVVSNLYNFPDVETKNAVLRLESAINPSIFTEVNFEIGKENIEFLVPNRESILCDTNKTLQFLFTPNYTDKIVIWISYDNQKTWRRTHIGFLESQNGTLNWKTSNIVVSDSVFVRATLFSDNTVLIGLEGPFKIEHCEVLSVENDIFNSSNQKDGQSKLFIDLINPNPASDKVNINIINNTNTIMNDAKLQLLSINGSIVKEMTINNLDKNTTIDFDVNSISQGSYIISIKKDNLISNRNLIIIKK